jgi:hypothetical protein
MGTAAANAGVQMKNSAHDEFLETMTNSLMKMLPPWRQHPDKPGKRWDYRNRPLTS